MDYTHKEELVKGLQQAMGNEVKPGDLSPYGHYIDARIAFESWTDEEKEKYKDRFGQQEEAIEEQKQKIIEDNRKRAQLKEALIERRNNGGSSRRTSIRSGEQFWTK